MIKNIPAPFAGDVRVEWVEIDSRIYTGPETGYSAAVHVDANSEASADSVPCEAFWQEGDHWGFIFKSGHVCLVHVNRIRYIKGRLRAAIEAEGERNDVLAVDDGVKQLADDVVHEPTVAPKRRGRPPKVRE